MAAPLLSKRIFDKYDSDKSGSISTNEFRNLCQELGHHYSNEEIIVALKMIDKDSSGMITYEEFKACNDKWGKMNLNDEQMQAINRASTYFRYFDKDHSGVLDKTEFKSLHTDLVKNKLTTKSFEDCLTDLDSSRDGKVTFNEYMDWLVRIGSIPIKIM